MAVNKVRISDRHKKQLVSIRYSPLLENHGNYKNFRFKNFLKPLRTSFTPYYSEIQAINKNASIANQHFKEAYELITDYNSKMKKAFFENNLQKEMNKIKTDTIVHCKRLAKKRKEEIDRGVHEYANYIVSMIHSSFINEA